MRNLFIYKVTISAGFNNIVQLGFEVSHVPKEDGVIFLLLTKERTLDLLPVTLLSLTLTPCTTRYIIIKMTFNVITS